METVLVQINNSKAYKLLKDLEDLHILKVLQKSVLPQQKLSEKYKGVSLKKMLKILMSIPKQYEKSGTIFDGQQCDLKLLFRMLCGKVNGFYS